MIVGNGKDGGDCEGVVVVAGSDGNGVVIVVEIAGFGSDDDGGASVVVDGSVD